ncbi:hypothetical protein VDGL01_01614 [Verticillium dahliae]|nr:Delta(24(24(1)))-sterol reductase [Verticillium dahliae VDG2]
MSFQHMTDTSTIARDDKKDRHKDKNHGGKKKMAEDIIAANLWQPTLRDLDDVDEMHAHNQRDAALPPYTAPPSPTFEGSPTIQTPVVRRIPTPPPLGGWRYGWDEESGRWVAWYLIDAYWYNQCPVPGVLGIPQFPGINLGRGHRRGH